MCFEGKCSQNWLRADKNESRSLLAVDIQGHQRGGGFCIVYFHDFTVITAIILGKKYHVDEQSTNLEKLLQLAPHPLTCTFNNADGNPTSQPGLECLFRLISSMLKVTYTTLLNPYHSSFIESSDASIVGVR